MKGNSKKLVTVIGTTFLIPNEPTRGYFVSKMRPFHLYSDN